MMSVHGKNKENLSKRFLRRPLRPKLLPKLPLTPPPNNSTAGEFLVEPEFYYEEGEYPDITFNCSGTWPPPPSELHTNSISQKYKSPAMSTKMQPKSSITGSSGPPHRMNHDQTGCYILDPLYRQNTNLGTYVEGKSLMQPHRPRGPCPLPTRMPLNTIAPEVLFDEDVMMEEQRYKQLPKFTLEDFLQTVSDRGDVPLVKVQEIMYSKHNYTKIQDLLSEHLLTQNTTLTKVTMLPTDIPSNTPRIPQKQLLIEMAALIKEQMSATMGTNIRPIIRKLPKFSPDYKPGKLMPHTEIVVYEDNPERLSSKFPEQTQHSSPPGPDKLLADKARHFQGSRRSREPFNLPENETISPSEMAVLDCLVNGGTALSVKAMFISQLPEIELLLHTITYLNLSFNNFDFIPYEIFELEHLTILKMRNNPIREIPDEISTLQNLQVLVFSFCLVTILPLSLFNLKKLIHLDFAYNKVSCIPNQIKRLRCLRELNIEGNNLPAMPPGLLRIRELRHLRCTNNYMHPLFWRENARNSAQRLSDICLRAVFIVNYHIGFSDLPATIITQLQGYQKCDCCKSVLFGPGLKVIRPVRKVFNIRNLPIMFRSCSSTCYDSFQKRSDSLVSLLYGVVKY